MQKALFIKAALVALISSILLIPLSMIHGVVLERAARQQEVIQDIAGSSFGKQAFAGPILSLPYTEEFNEEIIEGKERRIEHRLLERTLRLFPATLDLSGNATVAEKHRGLFKVRTFTWQANARGDFMLDGRTKFARSRADSRIAWGQPVISLGVSDPRGLVGAPTLEWAGQSLAMERSSGVHGIASGLHATIAPLDPTQPQRLPYSLAISLQGTESLGILPVGDSNRVRLKSDWRHPSFTGQFLPQPESQKVDDNGFDATWNITALASNAQQQLQALLDGNAEGLSAVDRLEVGFIEPVDIYSLSDRALKYGFLFIALTFGCFLLFEAIKGLRIHPTQYLLVGLALAIFFLLLFALSEHVAFWLAYLIAAASCIAMSGFYLNAVLQGFKRALSFSLMLTALYSALYGLLVSEDNALLLGSLMVFALVGAAMVLTRHLDWYSVGVRS